MVMPGFHGRTWTRRPGIQGVEGRHLAPIFLSTNWMLNIQIQLNNLWNPQFWLAELDQYRIAGLEPNTARSQARKTIVEAHCWAHCWGFHVSRNADLIKACAVMVSQQNKHIPQHGPQEKYILNIYIPMQPTYNIDLQTYHSRSKEDNWYQLVVLISH